jgi:16S rRNA (cytosine1402-N4)-methyltransferase
MRLDPRLRRTAADWVNQTGEKELADLIYEFSEERYSRRIARAIVAERKRQRIDRTVDLSRIIERAVPAPAKRGRHGVHPATRTFQALRIAVNEELRCLDQLLKLLPKILTPGGRAAIISFHSLEDRRVKQAFADWAAAGGAAILTKKPRTATEEEIVRNPRSRSAKLRGIERMAR